MAIIKNTILFNESEICVHENCVLLEVYNELGFLKLIINQPKNRNAINYEVMDKVKLQSVVPTSYLRYI